MSQREYWINLHLRRLRLGQFLHRSAEWLAGFLFLFGTVILVSRVLAPGLWPYVLWCGVIALPVLLAAFWFDRDRRFTREESVALLDQALRADGLLMTLTERSDQDWEVHLPQMERLWKSAMPKWRPRRTASYLAIPAMFTVCVFFVPLNKTSSGAATPLTAGRQAAQRLDELFQTLQEADALRQDEEQSLREEIERIIREAEHTPLTHARWEAVDSLTRRMQMRLTESLSLTQQAGVAAQLLALALEGEDGLSPDRREQLEEQVLEALKQLSSSSQGGLASSSNTLQRAAQSGRLPSDPQERAEMLKELSELLQQEASRLSELRSKCQGGLCQLGEDGGAGECESPGEIPGRGGINRGPGAAAISFGEESDDVGAKFREIVLPPGYLDDADVQGITLTAPEAEPATMAPRGAVQRVDPSSGMETWSRTVRPRHRSVVRQYFDSPASMSGSE